MRNFITRRGNRGRSRRRKKFASGKNAIAICERSGFQYPLREMVREPGTGFLVHWSESDGRWNAVTHPRNFSPDTSEAIGLKDSRPARIEPSPNYIFDENSDTVLDENGSPIYYVD